MGALAMMTAMVAATTPWVFPVLEGRNLAGQEVTVPGSYPGKVLMVCLGFTRDSQYEVEPWAQLATEAFGKDDRFVVLEMPMYSGAARLFRPFIDNGMARATPQQLHGNVVTSTSVDEAMDGLRLEDKQQAAIALVGPDGVIRFFARGAPTPQNRDRFKQALAAMQAELRPAK